MTELRFEPAEAFVSASDAMPTPMYGFALFAVRDDGSRVPVSAEGFRVEHANLGAMAQPATFTAAPGVAGVTHVFAYANGLTAVAQVTVQLDHAVMPAGMDPAQAARFATPIADPAAHSILYPLAGAVMPRNVAPPMVQWTPTGAAGDVFRVRFRSQNATITTYAVHSGETFPHALALDHPTWGLITGSGPDVDVTVEVDRLENATGRTIAALAPRTFRVARGSIFGEVYYWNLSRGETHRIDPVAATSTVVVPAPPPGPDGGRCIACHTVSDDGRYLWGRRGDGAGQMFDLTSDLSPDPAPTRYPVNSGFVSATFDPTGRYLLGSNNWSGLLGVTDAATGSTVDIPGMPDRAGWADWAAVGDLVTYMGDLNVDEGGVPIDGDIFTMRMTSMDPLRFDPPVRIHEGSTLAGAPEGGTNDSRPSFSPDGAMIAFQHGARTLTNVNPVPAGAIYSMAADGSNLHRLEALDGGTNASYWPMFSPYTTAEKDGRRYYWVAFFSRRDYGNAIAGTQGSQRRQLWVGAIDTRPAPGVDPSFVPYWMPGQDPTVQNIAAFWAPDSCRATGEGCGSGGDCCSEVCEPDAALGGVCAPPPAEECRAQGETCGGAGDCCDNLTCVGNRCFAPLL